MPTPLEYISVRAPSFASELNLSSLISLAEAETTGTYQTAEQRNKAVALLVCHWIALNKRDSSGGTAGAVSSEKVGDVSRSYQALSGVDDPDLSQTSWGVELYRHKKACFFGLQTGNMS